LRSAWDSVHVVRVHMFRTPDPARWCMRLDSQHICIPDESIHIIVHREPSCALYHKASASTSAVEHLWIRMSETKAAPHESTFSSQKLHKGHRMGLRSMLRVIPGPRRHEIGVAIARPRSPCAARPGPHGLPPSVPAAQAYDQNLSCQLVRRPGN
jgi:hypothetical protein